MFKNKNFLYFNILMISVFVFLASDCKNTGKSVKKSEKIKLNQKKSHTERKPFQKTTSGKEKIYAEGNLKISGIKVASAGGIEEEIPAGDRISVAFRILNIEKFEKINVTVSIASPDGKIVSELSSSVNAAQVMKRYGILKMYILTEASWISGRYTLEISLKQRDGINGKIYVPFTVKGRNIRPVNGLNLSGLHIPLGTASSEEIRLMMLLSANYKPLPSVLKFDYEIFKSSKKITSGTKNLKVSFEKTPLFLTETNLPPLSEAGKYTLFVKITDLKTGKYIKVGKTFTITNSDRTFGKLYITDYSGFPKRKFERLEEGKVFVTLFGKPLSSQLDLAITGQNGGLYMIKKNIPVKPSEKGNTIMLPFTVPEFAPAGSYTIRLRLRNSDGIKENSVLQFSVNGKKLRLTGQMRIFDLKTGDSFELLNKKQTFYRSGRKVFASFAVSGFKQLRRKIKIGKKSVELPYINIKCSVSIKNPLVEEPVLKKEISSFKKVLYHSVPALRLSGEWKIPPVKYGRFLMILSCTDLNSRNVSELRRLVTIK